jgi:hypothetical protein
MKSFSLRGITLPVLAPAILCAALTANAPIELGVCPPSVNETSYYCCYDADSGHWEPCTIIKSISATSGPDCEPCNFVYSVTITCAGCGTLTVAGESGLSCASRETHTIPCPDGQTDAIDLHFICSFCEIIPEPED